MTDEQTEALKRFNDEQAKIVAEYVKKSNISEIETLKSTTQELKENSKYDKRPFDLFLSLLDSRIADLKGKTNDRNYC